MRCLYSASVAGAFLLTPLPAYAQYGVCDRAANDAVAIVNSNRQRKINIVYQYNYPPPVIQAHLDIINYSHQDAMAEVSRGHFECARGFRPPQQIVNAAVTAFTMGLNRALPPGMVRIDISEAIAGYPLGGPNALIPRAREQILQGNNSTPANIARDPWKCLTFQRKC
jgi:hypothetical protein